MYILTLTIWRSLFDVHYLTFAIWRSLFSFLVKSHSTVRPKTHGNGFFSFFDAYLQVIIYKFHSIVNIKFLYKVCNFSNRCKFLFLRESYVWETFFCTDRKPIISRFLKLFCIIPPLQRWKFLLLRESREILYFCYMAKLGFRKIYGGQR